MPSDPTVRQLAQTHAYAIPDQAGRPLPDQLTHHARFLHHTYQAFVREAEEEPIPASHAAEWVLDNFYVVQQAIHQIEEGLPPTYYRELPKLEHTSLAGYPRVYGVARHILTRVDGRLDIEQACHFLNAYQEVTPLTMGELWAMPIMLRVATLENLSHALAHVLDEAPPDGERASVLVSVQLTLDILVANCILSLRALETYDWQTFFERVSLVEQTLSLDPAQVYDHMTFTTRDRYRKMVERLARSAGAGEVTVAQAAIRLAQENDTPSRQTHVGYYLIDEGMAQLETEVGSQSTIAIRLHRWLFHRHSTFTYLGSITLLTLLALIIPLGYAAAAGASAWQITVVALLGLIPASTIAINLINWLISYLVSPRALPKIDFTEGIPAAARTMVVVPSMLTNQEEVDSLLRQLELHYLSNTDSHLTFALLTDFADAPEKHMPDDETLLKQVQDGIHALNDQYPDTPFYLFHRDRLWNPQEEAWMGWERKRGKLEEFNHMLLEQGETSYVIQIGDQNILPHIHYIITLDADTVLPRGSAYRLIGALAHPLNRPCFDPVTGRLAAGYTVLQPHTETKPVSANASLFSRIFDGESGFDLYTHAVSDVYQDLFGEGIYTGKGIYDLKAFAQSLAGRVPENALLSHDLFEGIHGRAALVSDITLYEETPSSYLAYAHRLHRWIRGDWQLLPWLAPHVPHRQHESAPNPLSPIDYWKVVDNMRRSLLAPVLLAWLIAGWLWLSGAPLVWTTVIILAPAITLFNHLAGRMVRRIRTDKSGGSLWPTIRRQGLHWLLSLTFLPYEALITVDAIAAVFVRLFITNKRLLQWTTTAHTMRLFGKERKLALFWGQMWIAPALALALATLILWLNPAALPIALPLLLVWLLSPQIALRISRPISRQTAALTSEQQRELHCLARVTWHYFEQFVGPEDHWLPPDHFQEAPRGVIAHRTSPTNIGLMLLSTLGAFDLGYLGLLDLTFRLQNSFDSLDSLERHRGHFLNWYDTRTRMPLPPRYVSTVDSGNLVGSLIALRQGCLEMSDLFLPRWACWQGLLDTLGVLDDVISQATSATPEQITVVRDHIHRICQQIQDKRQKPETWLQFLTHINETEWPQMAQKLATLANIKKPDATFLHRIRRWSERISHHLFEMQRHLGLLVPWPIDLHAAPTLLWQAETGSPLAIAWERAVDSLPFPLRLRQIPGVCQKAQTEVAHLRHQLSETEGAQDEIKSAQQWCDSLIDELDKAAVTATNLLDQYQSLSRWIEKTIQEMPFDFLYDQQRHVFHIGYQVDAEKTDPNYYDLLASEARMTSLIAIARGDVPLRHWLHLGRPLTELDGERVLLSWSATMFEYLMPLMLMRRYDQTLLDQSMHSAVDRQIAYAREQSVPWGISESGYYRFDAQLNYQYRAFGVPGLGFKRGLEDDLVIAPYASLLALPLRPQAVMENIGHLRDLEMMGDYGFYEAIDYTARRLPLGHENARVHSFMVHHQGMIFVSLLNTLAAAPMVRRFHADRRIQSVEMLLQEQIPQGAPLIEEQEAEAVPLHMAEPEITAIPWTVPVQTPFPQTHYLSNGRYGLLITNAGGGYSRWQETDLTRWRADTTRDDWGTWIYLQDRESGQLRSVGTQPCGGEGDREILFAPHQVVYRCAGDEIAVRTAITVSPEDDVEIRLLHLTNQGGRPRLLRLVSYGEIVLNQQTADKRHPAFNKLFIESSYHAGINALLFTRRPRSAGEKPPFMAHFVVPQPGLKATGAYEMDRERFIGRYGSPRCPAALALTENGLSINTDATLDPIMALEQEIDLPPYGSIEIAFLTLAAPTHDAALALARQYQDWGRINHAISQAQTHSEMEMRQMELDSEDIQRFQQLLSLLLYPHAALRSQPELLATNGEGQPGLWPYAISGDYPILLVQISQDEELGIARELLQAHTYWRNRGLQIDLVLMNMEESGYFQELQGRLHRLLSRMDSDDWLNRRGGIFLLTYNSMRKADQTLLLTAARVVLNGRNGSLSAQLQSLLDQPVRLPPMLPTNGHLKPQPTPPLPRPDDLLFDNEYGGFSADGREYCIYLQPGTATPAPWINVIANDSFGFMVSEAGSGNTWAVNSGENRLTPWRNDPVRDRPGEVVYLRDEETCDIWSPTPQPAGEDAPYLIRHGAGYTIFQHHSHGLKQRLRLFAAPEAPVKIVQLRLENVWNRPRRITATYYAEWVLGVNRDEMQPYIMSEYDDATQSLLVRNPYNTEFGERVAFAAACKGLHGLTADRTEFLGRLGDVQDPAALNRVGLNGNVGAGLDPCAALQLHLDMEPGQSAEIYFFIGQGADRDEAIRLVERFQNGGEVATAWEETGRRWDKLLNAITVETPDEAMNLLLNRWLLFQNLSCRIWGRSAFYQSGGAYGFRDQLQDVLGVLLASPEVARQQIVRAARHQFEAGDVLHWWHPPSGRGVRTRISDDMLWLPYVTAQYTAVTGDTALLREKVPFRKGKPLQPNEEERYNHYELTGETHTIYEHCCRALEKGATAGAHGLPLMGGGDWNDSMNRVGIEGKGESIWLGWFLYATLQAFIPLCRQMDDEARATQFERQAAALQTALANHAWDGNWYLRAYYDDGTPLGSAQNEECRIDGIAQSWSVLSGAGDPERVRQAIAAVHENLIDEPDGLIRLFTPPFDKTKRDPGYIKGYPPGIRENGGQYTHAAIWTVWAMAELGQGDQAEALFRLLNPIYHSDTRLRADQYRVEPYVIAADVYGEQPFTGRGGWTWYTGSGSWFYRLGMEAILGLHRQGDTLRITPCIPQKWGGYTMTYRHDNTTYRIRVENPDGVNQSVQQVTLDGKSLPDGTIPLGDDGAQHDVRVYMGMEKGNKFDTSTHRSIFSD